jgi:hypothetical protein
MMYETQHSRVHDDDVLTHRLNIFKQELLESMSRQKFDTSDMMSTLRSMNEHQTLTLSSRLDHIPQLSYKLNTVTDKVSSMSSKVDTFSSARNTSRYKGEEGEKGLHDVLENVLSCRDGYTIVDTKSVAHSCDMVIRRVGYPDIRVESKAHGRDTGESVRTQEVKRFESDLTHLNSHGIFVSLYSGICGKGAIEFELLPTTKKFAFYLSRNEFDGHMISEIVRLIYKLDTFVSDKEGDILTITRDSMFKIKSYMSDFNRKIEDLKTNSKNSLRILNELTLDVIEKLLTNEHDSSLTCGKCNNVFKNKAGLTLHSKKCQVTG